VKHWASVAEIVRAIDDLPAGTEVDAEPTVQQDANMLLSRGRGYLADVLSILLDNTAQRG
jgi:hypothetical protein